MVWLPFCTMFDYARNDKPH